MTLDKRAVPAIERRQSMGLGVLCLAALLVSLHGFVLLLALPAVSAALGATSTQQLWILDVYGFMVAGLLITMGNLGDRIGRRRLLLISAAVFGAASIVAAYSVNPGMLIGSRAVLGVADAAITACSLSLISTLFPDTRQRATALGIWGGCFSVGAVVGPVVGGVLLNQFWWGSAFLIDVPAMIVVLAVGPAVLPEYRNQRARRIDVSSVVLSLAAILPAIHGLKRLASHGVGTQSVSALLIGGLFAWIFVRRQRRIADPLVDVGIFTRRTSLLLGSMMFYSMLSSGVMVFVAQYFQLVRGMTPLAAGVALVPGMATSAIAFQLAPRLARQLRPGILIPAGLLCTVAGMALTSVSTSMPLLVIAFAIQQIGSTPLMVLGTNLVISSVPSGRAGSAGALTQTSIEFGYALGIAVLGSVVAITYRTMMNGRGPSSLEQAITGGAPPVVLDAARHAFTTGVHMVAGVSALAVIVLGFVLVRALRGLPPLGNE